MAKKTAQKRKYHELTNPTNTSRVLTWLMLLLIPVCAFFLGMQYQESISDIAMMEMKSELMLEQFNNASPSADTVTE